MQTLSHALHWWLVSMAAMAAAVLGRPLAGLPSTGVTSANKYKKLTHFRRRPLPAPVRALSSEPAAALDRFWKWARDKGVVAGSSPPVRPAAVPEGLGLVAQRDIARNEVVIEVPKRVWIDKETVAASEIGRVCGELKPWVAIALFLLRERAREDSAWGPYLDVLPSTTDSTIFWSEKELTELQGTQLLTTTLSVKDYVQSEFLETQEKVIRPNSQLFASPVTFEDFLWAFGMLRSRVFSRLRGDGLVLIPFADLINHSCSITTEDTTWEIRGTGIFSRELMFSIRSPIPIKAGNQLLIQYDLRKTNAELALDYGFVEESVERNAFTLTLEIPESDPFVDDKLDIAESNGIGETGYFDVLQGQALPPTLLPYLRLVVLGGTDAFLLEPIFRNSVWGHLELPVSRDNEELMCRVIRDACRLALAGYHTTIEKDEALLKGGNVNSRLQIAVEIRAGEKKVLQQIDKIFADRETELDGLEYYQERRLKQLGLVGEKGEIIFWE